MWMQQQPMQHSAYEGRLCVVSAVRRAMGKVWCPLGKSLALADLEHCKDADSKENALKIQVSLDCFH